MRVDWKSLYGRRNGWQRARLKEQKVTVDAEFISSMCLFTAGESGWDQETDDLMVLGTSDGVEVIDTLC